MDTKIEKTNIGTNHAVRELRRVVSKHDFDKVVKEVERTFKGDRDQALLIAEDEVTKELLQEQVIFSRTRCNS